MLTLSDAHLSEAMVLYRRRRQCLSAPVSPLADLQQLDLRLAANLDAIAQAPLSAPSPSLKAPALFVHAWAGLRRAPARTFEQLDESYADFDQTQREAVAEAIELVPGDLPVKVQQSSLKAALLARQHGTVTDLLAGLQDADDEIAAVLLAQLDAAGLDDLEVFQSYYDRDDMTRARKAALQAGLVRGDRNAVSVAASCYPHSLAFSLLLARAGNPPETLLGQAFSGTAEAAQTLLQSLGDISCCDPAAQAWLWLTGQMLPRKARLQAVGGESGSNNDTIPDADVAVRWWQARQWRHDVVYFFGCPLTAESLAVLAGQYTGQLATLIALQRSVLAGRRMPAEPGFYLRALSEDGGAHA